MYIMHNIVGNLHAPVALVMVKVLPIPIKMILQSSSEVITFSVNWSTSSNTIILSRDKEGLTLVTQSYSMATMEPHYRMIY